MIGKTTFRNEAPGDRSAVLRLLTNAKLPTDDLAPVPDLRDARKPAFVLAVRGEHVIGCAAIEHAGPFALLRSVAVEAGARQAGVGDALVRNRIAFAETNSVQTIYLLTETVPAWFERFGFQTIERTDAPREIRESAEFSSLCCESATVMVRKGREANA